MDSPNCNAAARPTTAVRVAVRIRPCLRPPATASLAQSSPAPVATATSATATTQAVSGFKTAVWASSMSSLTLAAAPQQMSLGSASSLIQQNTEKEHFYDAVFGEDASQVQWNILNNSNIESSISFVKKETLFESEVVPLVNSFLEGFNTTLFA